MIRVYIYLTGKLKEFSVNENRAVQGQRKPTPDMLPSR